MATHHQTEPSLPHLESLAHCKCTNTNDVYSITQLSIGVACESPTTTSNQLNFSCQIETNSNGNLLFPLAETITNYIQKTSNQNLLNYLKSQQILKTIDIFKEIKIKQTFINDHQQFPLNELPVKRGEFPVKNNLANYSNHSNNVGRGMTLLLKNIKVLRRRKASKRNNFIKSFAKNPTSFKFKRLSRIKRIVKKLRNKNNNGKKWKTFTLKAKEENNKFPLQLFKTKTKFPFVYKFQNEAIENSLNLKQQFEFNQIIKTLRNNKNVEDDFNNLISITKFPCRMFANAISVTKFPINNTLFFNKHSLRNDLNINISKNPNTSITNSVQSLSLTQSDRNMKNFHNEHVFQVQDTHVQAMEKPQSFTMMEENKQTPPQTALATGIHDANNHEDIHKLADINSKNNSHSSEVRYYAEKIEHLQDAIISLFEKIKNSLITNHKIGYESTIYANKHVDHGNKGNTRFALTPPLSVTSVQNTESINNNKEVPYEKFDLADLYVEQICDHIVECSEVRDTLTEAVECGNTKEDIKSTGSFLVKSEEPISPNTLYPQRPLYKTDNTSLDYNSSVRELLFPNNENLDGNEKHYLESDSDKITDNHINLNNELSETVLRTLKNNLPKDVANEMTVTRLNKNDKETASQLKSYPTNRATEHQNNILSNKKDSSEMKFEMHKITGVLPSSAGDRATSKRDNIKTLTNNPISSNRLPISTNSSRNYNEHSYAPRSVTKNESTNLTSARGAYLNSPQLQDNIKNRTTSLNEVPSHRVSLNIDKNFNNFNTEPVSQRSPSLGSVRSTQSSSQLSVDLPRYTPLSTTNQLDKSLLNNRAASIDSTTSDVLPERTRLRRQRRLRAQDSQDEPEDAIERLNRLRARISASLSEVKGVLKQYSTESENENQIIPTPNTIEEIKEDDKKEGPVTFRFVKKVRRRSLFSEDDEKELPKFQTITDNQQYNIDETDHCKAESSRKEECVINEIKGNNFKEGQHEVKADYKTILLQTAEMNLNTNLYTLNEETLEIVESKDDTDHCKLKSGVNLSTRSSTLNELKELVIESQEDDNTLRANCNYLNNELEETKHERLEQTTRKDEKSLQNESSNKNEPELKGAIPKLVISTDQNKSVNDNISDTHNKLKKKIITKHKDKLRRASLAAVEGSKVESPLKAELPNKLQRRPSDSEALVKKKLLTAKLNTSGVVAEVTPKPKIVVVKKSSVKNNSNNSTQLANMQTEVQEEDFTLTAANVKSDEHNKLLNKDNKSITSDKNQDVLMPKEDLEKQQLPLKNEITRQTNLWLPTQLVIDEAASLNKKTIENSVLTPRQQKQKEHLKQNQQEQDQQATIKSTATNFKSNDLQAKGAMLENVTNAISSSTTSEANGQLTRDKAVQSTDYHDLLQTEVALNTPNTTNRSNDIQLIHKVESLQSKANISSDKSNENLEKHKSAISEQQDKQQCVKKNQQVLETTDFALNTNDGNNNSKHENLKATATLKEPCKENTTTSTHVELVQQQQQQLQREGAEQSITNDTKTTSSPHNSISCTSDITHQTTTKSVVSTECEEKQKAEVSVATQQNKMPELQLAHAPVQTAEIISHPEHNKKKVIIKKIIRHSSVERNTKTELNSPQETHPQIVIEEEKSLTEEKQIPNETIPQLNQNDLAEECSESTEISESSTPLGSEEISAALDTPKKERIVKKKVIIKRQKRRLSIGDNFFHSGNDEQQQTTEIETLEKPIAFFSDDEAEYLDEKAEEAQADQQTEEEKKPLRSCILRKEYNIGDEVLYAERFKKTQIKWRRGRIKERITSISYLLDIDGKDVSSHINYLKKFTGRKVSFGGKEYLEIDYEQLAEEEEKAEKLKKRTYNIWNMV